MMGLFKSRKDSVRSFDIVICENCGCHYMKHIKVDGQVRKEFNNGNCFCGGKIKYLYDIKLLPPKCLYIMKGG